MLAFVRGSLVAAAVGALPLTVQAQDTTSSLEFAFMPESMTVALLNDGGKYVAVDLKHIPKGGTCRMEKDSLIAKVGPGSKSGTTQVRYAAAQLRSGGCPFMTVFEVPDATYAKGRASFVQMQDDASKKVDEIKKELGKQWDELVGKKG